MTYPMRADVEAIVGLICQSIEHSHRQRLPDALACLDAGLRLHPGFFPCRVARAKVLAAMERFDEALADLGEVLRQAALPEVLAAQAGILDTAMAYLASSPDADQRKLHMACGDALCNQGRFSEAIAAYDRVLAIEPDSAAALYNCGNVLQKQGRLHEAMACYRRALAVAPQFAEAHLEEVHCLLALGDLGEGWRRFEWRWQTSQLRPAQLASSQPRWLGQAGLAGKTILLWAEQGYGDAMQFARFVPRVADLAGKVVLRLPEPLRLLLCGLDQRVTVIGDSEPLPAHDCHTPLMSLPLALGVDNDAALAAGAYLRADAARMQAWQARLGDTVRRRIGLCWAGRRNGTIAYNPSRDASLAALLPLAVLDAQFICLQTEYTPAEDALLAALPNFLPLRQGLDHFAETAALVAGLELVITVDTAIAHLAGALGKPCWLLLRSSGEWRWRLERPDTPWYPTIKIFRQQAQGDWDEVVRRVLRELTCYDGGAPSRR